MNGKGLKTAILGTVASVAITFGASAAETVKLGMIEPLSGPVAGIGNDVLEQLQFNVDRVNAAGGVLGGRMLELYAFDNAMNAEKTTQQLKKVVDLGVRFVTQGVGSNHALNIIKFLGKHNRRNPSESVLYLNSAAVTTAFTNELCSFWHFRFDANVDMKVAALTSQMGQDASVKKVYMLNQNYAYGKSFQAAGRRLLKERTPNATLVGDELMVPFGKVQDFTPYIAKFKSSGADTILTGNWGPDFSRLIKAMAGAGLDAQVYSIYGGITSSIAGIGSEDYKKVVVKQVTEHHDNDPSVSAELREYSNQWLAATKKTWYGDRFRWVIEMFAAALDKAGSDDPVAVALALEGMTFNGPGGEVMMRSDDHQMQLPMVISTASADVDNTVIYNGKDFGVGFKTDAWVSRADLELPTTCSMKRPS